MLCDLARSVKSGRLWCTSEFVGGSCRIEIVTVELIFSIEFFEFIRVIVIVICTVSSSCCCTCTCLSAPKTRHSIVDTIESPIFFFIIIVALVIRCRLNCACVDTLNRCTKSLLERSSHWSTGLHECGLDCASLVQS